jgi:hypothetical protein
MSYEINVTEEIVEINTFTQDANYQRYYGAFVSTVDQLNAGATSTNKMTYNVTNLSYGVSIVSNSRITMANAGVYNIQFSAQIFKDDSGTDRIDIWLQKNGQNVANSNTEVVIVGNDGRSIASWNFLEAASAGDYFEICWSSADTQLYLEALATQSNPTRPAIPSVILTVTQI